MLFRPLQMRILYPLLLLQAAFAIILCFGDIGFDKPGRYGFDFDLGIILLVLYIAALLLGLAFAAKLRRFWWFGVQFLPILCVGVYFVLPAPRFEVSRYQFLVGKTKAELVRAIGSPRGALTGAHGGPGQPDEEFVDLRGMTVFISSNGTVVRVESNNR